MRRGSQVRAVASAVVVVAIVGIVAYSVLPLWKTADVAVPPDDASPEQVVTAYLDALNQHDCGTAKAVATRHFAEHARSWCTDVSSLAHLLIHQSRPVTPDEVGLAPPAQAVEVWVRFDLTWRLFHGDPLTPDGTTYWGYVLERDSADAPWRINDEGDA